MLPKGRPRYTPSLHEAWQRQGVQIASKRDLFLAGVKQHPAYETFADRFRQRSQSIEIASADGGTGFDFDADQPAGAVLQHRVHFLLRCRAPEKKSRLGVASGGLLAGLPRADQQDDRRVGQGVAHRRGQMSWQYHRVISARRPADNQP